MSHRAFFKGMTIGLLAGTAIGAAVTPVMPKHKCTKKPTGKLLKTVGEILEHITGMFY